MRSFGCSGLSFVINRPKRPKVPLSLPLHLQPWSGATILACDLRSQWEFLETLQVRIWWHSRQTMIVRMGWKRLNLPVENDSVLPSEALCVRGTYGSINSVEVPWHSKGAKEDCELGEPVCFPTCSVWKPRSWNAPHGTGRFGFGFDIFHR